MKDESFEKRKFEDALDRLEDIIDGLQNGSLSLEDSIDKFEEGIKLVKACRKELDAAETKVNMLLKDVNGNMKEVPFSAGSEE